MAKSAKQNGRASRKSADPNQRKLHEVVASYFSSPPAPSQPGSSKGFRPRESISRSTASSKASASRVTTSKSTAKTSISARADRDAIIVSSSSDHGRVDKPILISSDSPAISIKPVASSSRSHISISSDSKSDSNSLGVRVLPPVRFRRPQVLFSSSSEAPAPSLRPRRLAMPKASTKSLSKRKHNESDDESPAEPVHVLRQRPTLRRPDLSSYSVRPLAPKDNVPSPSKAEPARKPSPPKKARLSSPEAVVQAPSSGNDADVEELIPSSQSDEQELCMPKLVAKDPEEVKESVDKWRQEAVAHEPVPEPDDFANYAESELQIGIDADVDMTDSVDEPPTPMEPATPRSETEVSQLLRTRSSGSTLASTRVQAQASKTVAAPAIASALASVLPSAFTSDKRLLLSPSPADLPSRPPTPVALDKESKTAQIMAEIRARAAEKAAEEEDVTFNLEELGSSSDDDDDDLFARIKDIKGKGKAQVPGLESSPLSKLDSSPPPQRPATRYSLRRKSPGKPVFAPKPEPKAKASPARKPRKTFDPLEVMLKEKRLADKRGNGSEALRAAEAAAASPSVSRQQMRLEMDAEEGSDADSAWADEDAAMRIVQQGASGLTLKSSSSACAGFGAAVEGDTESGDELKEADCEKILGAKGGKAVGKILASDRRSKNSNAKGKKEERVLGMPLWDTQAAEKEDDAMKVEPVLPPLPEDLASSGHPLISLLRSCIENGDATQVMDTINSGVLCLLGRHELSCLLPWLFRTAISDVPVAQSAHYALLRLCTSSTEHRALSFTLVVDVLLRLGANSDVLSAQGWSVDTSVEPPTFSAVMGVESVDRLVALISASAQSKALSPDHIPNFVLSLLLIALDASTSAQTKRDIAVAIEYLGLVLPSDNATPSVAEKTVCAKVVNFAKELTPVNKAHIVSLFVGCCPQTNRIARWIAYCLLLDCDIPQTDSYSNLPPLPPVIDVLSPPSGSEGPFDIQGNSDKDGFYEDLACHVDILSKALTSIDGYIADEKALAQNEAIAAKKEGNADDDEPKEKSKEKNEKPPPLEQIRILLEGLHGKIVDTRAAHLDRSRAKAALQQLAIRLHYQRTSGLRSKATQRNLDGYFTSK